MIVAGTIIVINAPVAAGQKTKRSVVVETKENPRYPQPIEVEFYGDRVAMLDDSHVGDEVSIEADLRGRKWDGPQGTRYFVSVNAYKMQTTFKAVAKSDVLADDDIPF